MAGCDDTTPLLRGAGRCATVDHPIFYRACHSSVIPQDILTWVRGLVVVYLGVATIMIMDYKIEFEGSEFGFGKNFFDFAMISWSLVLLYHGITFVGATTNLFFPYVGDNARGWEMCLLRFIRIPSRIDSLRKQFYFAFFFVLTHAWALTNTAEYFLQTGLEAGSAPPEQPSSPSNWTMPINKFKRLSGQAVLDYRFQNGTDGPRFQNDTGTVPPIDEMFGGDWFKSFTYINLYIVAAAISLLEILIFNSIRVPANPAYHVFGVILSSSNYLGWAFLGSVWIGYSAFDWMTEELAGGRMWTVLNSLGFIVLAVAMTAVIFSIIMFREFLDGTARKSKMCCLRDRVERYTGTGPDDDSEPAGGVIVRIEV